MLRGTLCGIPPTLAVGLSLLTALNYNIKSTQLHVHVLINTIIIHTFKSI